MFLVLFGVILIRIWSVRLIRLVIWEVIGVICLWACGVFVYLVSVCWLVTFFILIVFICSKNVFLVWMDSMLKNCGSWVVFWEVRKLIVDEYVLIIVVVIWVDIRERFWKLVYLKYSFWRCCLWVSGSGCLVRLCAVMWVLFCYFWLVR